MLWSLSFRADSQHVTGTMLVDEVSTPEWHWPTNAYECILVCHAIWDLMRPHRHSCHMTVAFGVHPAAQDG
jgi:hypothetical protein